MNGFAVKGWCPDAWRPMMAGDGLLVRIKPALGRLTRAQVLCLCDAALAYGNGLIDLTRRANLQLRGVGEADWRPLLDRLVAEGLVDADAACEARRNLLVAPDWQAGDDTHRLAGELLTRLDELPELPGKMGFVVDAGSACMLREETGDLRIERGNAGSLILRADGRHHGIAVAAGQEVDALIELARWFVSSGGAPAGRMARHETDLPGWAQGSIAPAAPRTSVRPGRSPLGMAYGLPFGRIEARVLAETIERSGATAARFTAWRVMILEGAPDAPQPGLIDDPADPLLHVDACPGAPSCPQATVETRDLARTLAPLTAGQLHVSGCGKGCARSRPARFTLTGRDAAFDLAMDARAGAPPLRKGLSASDILHHFGVA